MAERRGAYDGRLKAFLALCADRAQKAEARYGKSAKARRSNNIKRVFDSIKRPA
jgi:hypothetical protein